MGETIGILGGSFNPIHEGHLAMAEAAQRLLCLTRTILMPAGDPPHKDGELAPKRHRLHMARLAAGERFSVSDMEIKRPGKTFTVDTLAALREAYPGADLWMIIGGDTLWEIGNWRDAPRVFSLCRFAVFGRGDIPLGRVAGARVTQLEATIPDISATALRARVHRGMSLAGLTPPAVEAYIGAHRLYDPPVRMPDRAVRERLKRDLSPERYRHVLGVEATMRALAGRWGYDEERAALTGLLHDCAKGMSLHEMRAFVRAQGVPVDEGRLACRELLHAPAGAAMARAVYGVTDPDIYHAIRYHNTGSADMGMLDKLLWVADMAEPGRRARGCAEALRGRALEDLDGAARDALLHKLAFLRAHGREAHPDTEAACAALRKDIETEGKE